MRRIAVTYKIVRLLMAILTPEVTMFDIAMILLGWLLRRGPPSGFALVNVAR